MDKVEVAVEARQARWDIVGPEGAQALRSTELLQDRGRSPRHVGVRVMHVVASRLAFQHACLAPPGGIGAHLTGTVMRQILEDVGVDGAQMVQIELAADRALYEFRYAVGDKKRLAGRLSHR